MSDLDKLMKKLKDNPTKKEKAKKTPEVEEAEIEDEDDDEDEEDQEQADPVEPIPANVDPENSIEGEVGVLQNNGIYRRELLLIKKEQVDVLKVIAQTLLDIKAKLTGEDGETKD